MASAFKLATVVTLLELVDQGKIQLTDVIDIPVESLVAGPNRIATHFIHPGLKSHVANLIEPMIADSDNTAANCCLRLSGGPEVVTQMLRRIGITDQRADWCCTELAQDICGLSDKGHVSVAMAAYAKDPTLAGRIADRNLDFEKDPRDQSMPKAMLELLLAIDIGKILSEKSREFLLGVMSRTQTGGGRIAHKTGTAGGVADDVWFLTLPDGRRVAIAVFTKSSATPPQRIGIELLRKLAVPSTTSFV